ncbi:MAG: ribokinase [Pseudomonadota bacterium]
MILCVGSINVDLVYRLADLPGPGETLAARSFSRGLGGKGANQSVAAARAGAEVTHFCPVGADAADLLAQMAAAGVRHAGPVLEDQANGHASVWVSERSGENVIAIHAGTNAMITMDALASVCAELGPGDWVMLQNEVNLVDQAARLSREKGASVVYSAAPFEVAAVEAVLPHITHLLMNEGEDRAFRDAGLTVPENVAQIVTKGPNGAEWRSADVRFSSPALPVAQVVDTTGAGDCFAGNLVAALARGADPAQAMRWAQAAASVQISREGAAPAMPRREETQRALEA